LAAKSDTAAVAVGDRQAIDRAERGNSLGGGAHWEEEDRRQANGTSQGGRTPRVDDRGGGYFP
jgi:hypothetical protein